MLWLLYYTRLKIAWQLSEIVAVLPAYTCVVLAASSYSFVGNAIIAMSKHRALHRYPINVQCVTLSRPSQPLLPFPSHSWTGVG